MILSLSLINSFLLVKITHVTFRDLSQTSIVCFYFKHRLFNRFFLLYQTFKMIFLVYLMELCDSFSIKKTKIVIVSLMLYYDH